MMVATRNSRLAKIASSSWTKVPPKSAGARLRAPRQAEQHGERRRRRARRRGRRSSPRAEEPDEEDERGSGPPRPSSSASGLPSAASSAALRAGSGAARSPCPPGPSAMPGAHAEEHDDEDQDDERRPLGARRVGQVLEVRIGALRAPEDLLGRRAARRSTVRKAPSTPGKSHHGCADCQAPRNVRNSATKPAVAGRPSEDRPPIGEGRRDARHHPAEAAHLEDRARVRLLVDEADQREEEARS